MFLSRLHVDLGKDPDRPRPGRLWLRNLYRVHQRLCMAFPSSAQKENDPQFLKPFDPCGFQHVHEPRTGEQAFLFRVDPLPHGRAGILVQSAIEPDWNYAFHNARFLLAAPPETRQFNPQFCQVQTLRFRLLVNPTKRLSKNSREADGELVKKEWVGKRIPVPVDQLHEWLARRAEAAGFSFAQDSTAVQPGYIYFQKPGKPMEDKPEEKQKDKTNSRGQRLRSVRYDGVLKVTDPARFRETLVQGIGPGKAFGFGLLSVAPARR